MASTRARNCYFRQSETSDDGLIRPVRQASHKKATLGRGALLGSVAAVVLMASYGRDTQAQIILPPANGPCVESGGTTITCTGDLSDGVELTNGGGPYTTLIIDQVTTDIAPGYGTNGVFFSSDGDITVTSDTTNGPNGAKSIITDGAEGIFAVSDVFNYGGPAVSGDITISHTGDIETAGEIGEFLGADGIYASSYAYSDDYDATTGDVTVTHTGDITTESGSSKGVYASAYARSLTGKAVAGDVTVTQTGDIHTEGLSSVAIGVDTDAGSYDGDATTGNIVVIHTGEIVTLRENAEGINADTDARSESGKAVAGGVTVTHTGDITTKGRSSEGIDADTDANANYSFNEGTGDATTGAVTVTQTGNITTERESAEGVDADGNATAFGGDATTGAVTVTVVGDISTKGRSSEGIDADTVATTETGIAKAGAVTVTQTGNVITLGSYSDGFEVESEAYSGSGSAIAGAVTVIQSGDITTEGNGAEGIDAQSDASSGSGPATAGAVTITQAGDVDTKGDYADGIEADSVARTFGGDPATADAITVTQTGNIATMGDYSAGVEAVSQAIAYDSAGAAMAGNVTVTQTGDITTEGNGKGFYGFGYYFESADGIIAQSLAYSDTGPATAGNVAVTQTGDITTAGSFAHGIDVRVLADTVSGDASIGTVTVTQTGDITTKGDFAEGIDADADAFSDDGIAKIATVMVTQTGTITTLGDDAEGLEAETTAQSDYGPATAGDIIVTQTGDISTSGELSYGIYVESYAFSGTDAATAGTVTVTQEGDIITTGPAASGIVVRTVAVTDEGTEAGGDVTVMQTGDITASGELSEGIVILASSGTATLHQSGKIEAENGIVVFSEGDAFVASAGSIAADNLGIEISTETGDAELEIASTVTGSSGLAIDAIFVGGDTRLELQPGFGFDDDFVFANGEEGRDNRLVLGGPAGEATFDLATLDDGDYTPEGDEQIFGFQPIFLKEDASNFIIGGTNALPFDEALITGGVAALDDGANLVMAGPAPFTIADGGALGAIGDATLTGDVLNLGTILLSNGGGFDPIAGLDGADDTLTITGNYAAGSDLYLDVFADDGSSDETDLVVIEGDTEGETEVTVSAIGGPGGFTGTGPMDGILVVEVLGESEGSFVLTDEAIGNIFAYDLVQADGQNWYLQSSDYLDQGYVYESLPGAIQTIGLALAGQLVERVGVRSGAPSPLTNAAGAPLPGGGPVTSALWLRGVGQWLESEGDLDSTTGASFDQTTGFVQGGGEVVVAESASGRLLIGALAHWGTSSVDVDDASGRERGSSDIDFYGGGLTATWYGSGGLYVDGLVQYTAYDIDISTTSRFSSTSTDGDGFTVSGEVGYRIPISPTAALVPQAQLTWQSIDFDDFVDPDGIRVSLDDGDSLVGRLGLAAEANWAAGDALVTGYAEANLLHEFLGDNTVLASGTALSQDLGGTSVEFGVGTTVAFNETLSLYGEVDYTIPFDNGVEGLQAVAGLRWSFAPPPPPPPPAPIVAPVAETAFIVFFNWDRADLTSEANLVLDDVVVVANQSGYASIRLDGYTDLSGSAAYNLGLSERRANSVANGLIARGIAPDEIVIRAFGEENPLVPTPDGVREPQNRRVEIFLS